MDIATLTSTAALPWIALTGRVILLGIERIVVKRMGDGADPFAGTFLYFLLGAICIAPFIDWGMSAELWKQTLVSFGAGVIYAAAFVCYVHSLSIGEASLVSPLYNANVLFLAMLALVFLGEPITVLKIFGLVLLIIGASRLTPRDSIFASLKAVTTDPACRYMILASLLIACGRVVDTYMVSAATMNLPPLNYCMVLYLVISFYVFLALLWRGKAGEVVTLMKMRPGTTILAGAINGYSYPLLLIALNTVQVSVAEPVCMLGVLITMFMARKTFGEKIGKRLIAAGIMILGAWALIW